MRVDALPSVGPPPSTQACAFVGHAGGEVAVVFLCQADEVDDGVEILVEFLVIVYGKRIGCALDDLVGVGVIKREIATMLFHGGSHPAVVLGSKGEIVKPPVLLTFTKCGRDADCAIGLYAGCPEIISQVHLCERHLLNLQLGGGRKAYGASSNEGE